MVTSVPSLHLLLTLTIDLIAKVHDYYLKIYYRYIAVVIAAYLVYGVVLSKHNMESIDGVQNEFKLFINYELHNLHHTYLKNSTVFCTGNYYIYYRLIRTVCLD